MDKLAVLEAIDFGHIVAEDEKGLATYFVETNIWRKVLRGEIDVIYGMKGAGKSALYTLLLARREELRRKGILVLKAEEPHTSPVFTEFARDWETRLQEAKNKGLPIPTDTQQEQHLEQIWKLYFLTVIASGLKAQNLATDPAGRRLIHILDEARLLGQGHNPPLQELLAQVLRYLWPEEVQVGVQVDPLTQLPIAYNGKIVFRKPTPEHIKRGKVYIDDLYALVQTSVSAAKVHVWVALDRLDVAFANSAALETNALRALFRVYISLKEMRESVAFKIFMRRDLWLRITKERTFPEGSRIEGDEIRWDTDTLFNLVIRRLVHSSAVCAQYQVSPEQILLNRAEQEQLFYRIFPRQVERGPNKADTFAWMLSHTRDASQKTEPRELIHFLTQLKKEQIEAIDNGTSQLPDELLFDVASFEKAMPEVSRMRFEQTLCTEFPGLVQWMKALEREKTEYVLDELHAIWKLKVDPTLTLEQTQAHAGSLVEIGFFEAQKATDPESGNLYYRYWVPFLYRYVLVLSTPARTPGRRRVAASASVARPSSTPPTTQ